MEVNPRRIRTMLTILILSTYKFVAGQYTDSDQISIIKTKNYSMTIESSNYFIDNDTVRSKFCTIRNLSKDTLWIMFEPDQNKSDYDFIKNTFFSRKHDSVKLFNYLLDGNVNWTVGVFDTFFKLIPPKQSFNILIEGDSTFDIDLLIDRIRIIPQSFIFNNFGLIKRNHKNFDNQVFYYDKNYLIVTRRMLKNALKQFLTTKKT